MENVWKMKTCVYDLSLDMFILCTNVLLQKLPCRGIGGVLSACFERYWWVLVGIGRYWRAAADRNRSLEENGDIYKIQYSTMVHIAKCIQAEFVDTANQEQKNMKICPS